MAETAMTTTSIAGTHIANRDTWGLGRVWARLPLVAKNRWLI